MSSGGPRAWHGFAHEYVGTNVPHVAGASINNTCASITPVTIKLGGSSVEGKGGDKIKKKKKGEGWGGVKKRKEKKEKKKKKKKKKKKGAGTGRGRAGVRDDYRRENKESPDGHARAKVVLVVMAAVLMLVIHGRKIQAENKIIAICARAHVILIF